VTGPDGGPGGLRLAVPPGRAGRIWLDRRLAAARRGADLLDRKLRVLQAEEARLSRDAERTGQAWRRRAAEADRAVLLAALLGGERAIRLAAPAGHAQVRIGYTTTIGVRHPASASVSAPPPPAAWAGPATEAARAAALAAVEAAAGHAAAVAAAGAVAAEAAATRRRLRALTDRLIPALEQARAQVVLALDELEREDGARLRRFAGQAGPGP